MRKNIVIKNKLDKESILLYQKIFNKNNNCNWTLEQFKQSLKNQNYLNHYIFYQDNQLVGIIEYSINNPWDKIMFDIIYIEKQELKQYMLDYTKKNVPILKDTIEKL